MLETQNKGSNVFSTENLAVDEERMFVDCISSFVFPSVI